MGQPILEVEHLKKSYVNNVPVSYTHLRAHET